MKILSRGRDVPLMTPGESLRSRDRDDILFFFARYDYYYRRERSCSSRERTTNVYIFTRASESFIGRARDATFDNDRERRKFREDRGAPSAAPECTSEYYISRSLSREKRTCAPCFHSGNRPLSFATGMEYKRVDFCRDDANGTTEL